MDPSVALVQAYLHVNGYFTVAEYPVLEALRRARARSVTDLDMLAFRFPQAAHDVVRGRGHGPLGVTPDPVLGAPVDRPDMIVGEIKEGAARFNPATRDPAVLEIALARFGCCSAEEMEPVVRSLLSRGRAETPAGHVVRMVAFGAAPEAADPQRWTTVPMAHVVGFLRGYLEQHWDVLRHAQLREQGLSMLALLEKCRASRGARGG